MGDHCHSCVLNAGGLEMRKIQVFSIMLRLNSRSVTVGSNPLSAIQTLTGKNSFPIPILNLSLPFLMYISFLMFVHKLLTFKNIHKITKNIKPKVFIVPERVLYLWVQILMPEQMVAPAGLQMFVSLCAKPKSCCVSKD